MELFWEECRKILEKRILWIGLAVLAGFWSVFCVLNARVETVAGGVRYQGAEAIAKDREIAKEWEGVLTMEKLYQMVDTYGLALDEIHDDSRRTGNWVSQFATDLLTDYPYGGNGELLPKEDLEWLAQSLEKNRPYFTYLDGAEDFLLTGAFANFGVLLLIIIGVPPVFGEEYTQKTAPVLLTTVHGRKKDIKSKVMASIALAVLLYLLVNGTVFLSWLAVYGDSGLKAGACLISLAAESFAALTLGQLWLFNFAWGLLGVLMMSAITLFFSAKCKTPFLGLIWSLVCLTLGAVLINLAKAFLRFPALYLICSLLGKWSPLYLQLGFGWGQGNWEMPWKLLFVLAVGILSLWRAGQCYKKYEG